MKRHISLSLAVLMAAAVVACGGGSGGLGSLPPASPSSEPSGPVASPTASPDATPGGGSPSPTISPSTPPGTAQPSSPAPSQPVGTTIVRAYFWLSGDENSEGLVPVLREVPKTTAVARAAIEQLLLGPIGREADSGVISSAVPNGTELLGISIDDGVATVDLSGEFASGGGSTSTMVRLAQVTYTLTQFPTVQRVRFSLDGKVVTVFGSEGLVLDGPQARSDYYDLLPDIWVDRPAWGAALNNPGRVTGLSNVFEATFHIALLDRNGRVLFDQPVMATCGTGCWGTFDVTIAYDVPQGQYGTLRVYNLSARDGSVESQRDYPVWLTPAG